jgi:hypothetical protein
MYAHRSSALVQPGSHVDVASRLVLGNEHTGIRALPPCAGWPPAFSCRAGMSLLARAQHQAVQGWLQRLSATIDRRDFYTQNTTPEVTCASHTEARLYQALRLRSRALTAQLPVPTTCRGTHRLTLDCAWRDDTTFLLVAIEVDGPHHNHPLQVARDRQRDVRLNHRGWYVVRIPYPWLDSLHLRDQAVCAITTLVSHHCQAVACARGRRFTSSASCD